MISKITHDQCTSCSLFLLAFILTLQCSLFLYGGTAALAQTAYIKPSSKIVLRRGQGTEFKILAMVKNGTAVELLEQNGTYAKVRLANNKEGWILKRFLSNDPPPDKLVVSLRHEKDTLKQKEIETDQKLEALSTTLSQTEKELDLTIAERNQLRTDYQTLQSDTANVMQIKTNQQKTARKNKLLSQKLALIEQESENLRNDYALKWFLAGGGVLLIGILIGRVSSRSRRRRSSLF